MFNNITIKNFRGISELGINDFRRVNLFIGKNNCCKTSILEALFLASAPTNPELPFRINRFRGLGIIDEQFWHLLFNKFGDNHKIEITGELQKLHEKRSLIIEKLVNNKVSMIDRQKNLKSSDSFLKFESPDTLLKLEESYSNVQSRTMGIILQAIDRKSVV